MSLETTTETPPRMKVRPGVAQHGGMVVLALRGLRPFESLRIQAQAEATDDRVEHLVSTDSRGGCRYRDPLARPGRLRPTLSV